MTFLQSPGCAFVCRTCAAQHLWSASKLLNFFHSNSARVRIFSHRAQEGADTKILPFTKKNSKQKTLTANLNDPNLFTKQKVRKWRKHQLKSVLEIQLVEVTMADNEKMSPPRPVLATESCRPWSPMTSTAREKVRQYQPSADVLQHSNKSSHVQPVLITRPSIKCVSLIFPHIIAPQMFHFFLISKDN